MVTRSISEHLRLLLPWLASQGAAPTPDIPIQLCEAEWLAPLCFVRLGEQPHPLRARLNAAFNESFARRAKLDELWRECLAKLEKAGLAVITLGSLPFADEIYAHSGARFSQDIDLLVRPEDLAAAEAALCEIGWHLNPRLRLFERGGIQLDLHTTPGEEARTPILAEIFGHTTEQLFAKAAPCHAGGMELPAEVLLVNRVLHFFKHGCGKPLHGLEIALLARRKHDQTRLAAEIMAAKANKPWAFVAAVLAHWGLELDSEATDQPEAAQRAANLELGVGAYRVMARWMTRGQKWRFGWQLLWPSREELLTTYGVAEAGPLEALHLRSLRVRKFLNALLT